jgi:hypothetical protein
VRRKHNAVACAVSANVWHKRLGHVNRAALTPMYKDASVACMAMNGQKPVGPSSKLLLCHEKLWEKLRLFRYLLAPVKKPAAIKQNDEPHRMQPAAD